MGEGRVEQVGRLSTDNSVRDEISDSGGRNANRHHTALFLSFLHSLLDVISLGSIDLRQIYPRIECHRMRALRPGQGTVFSNKTKMLSLLNFPLSSTAPPPSPPLLSSFITLSRPDTASHQ